MASQETKMASQEPKTTPRETIMASQGPPTTTSSTSLVLPHKYSNRVLLKTVLERSDGGKGLVGERLVVGGWVKSSKEVRREAAPLPHPQAKDKPRDEPPGPKEMSCTEILQSRMPLFRSIIKILGVGGRGGIKAGNYPVSEKVETVIARPPPPSIAYLLVSDGSCATSLQITVDSSLASLSRLLPIGTCILAEGVLKQATIMVKHSIELKADKILHIGAVDDAKYPLSKKQVPLDTLRDCSHFRPRTTTVASVMRIRSALAFATETFFQNNGFLSVQVPIITTTDCEGSCKKFQVTTLFSEVCKKVESRPAKDTENLDLEVVKGAIKEKSSIVEELKRTESNREALAAAIQDLQKTNLLASQLEAKSKSGLTVKADKTTLSEDFFSRRTCLTTSGLFHLESYACALGNVYTFGPIFRADRKESPKKVAEMWMLEVQMAFSQLEDAMNSVEDYLKFLCKWVLDNCSGDMKFIAKRIDKTSIGRLQSLVACSFEKISYREAVDILKKVTDKVFETKLKWGIALTAEHLSYLADQMYKRPVIVYNHPKEVEPFYVRLNGDGNTVAAFDVVIPKVGTLISGSQSEERIDVLNARIKEAGLSREQYEWYLDLRRHGTVKHSGFSLSFDLFVLFTTGLTDVRDAIPFPRSFGKADN